MRRSGLLAAGLLALAASARAGPWVDPGDPTLRSDLATLADAGVVTAPITTWPMPWRDIILEVRDADAAALSPVARMALARVQAQARAESLLNGWSAAGRLSAAEKPRMIRTFEDTPREQAEAEGAVSFMTERVSVRLNATYVSPEHGNGEFKADGTFVGVTLGGWTLVAGYPERWWGPGWDGSLILSTSARPMPQIALSRSRATPFERRWLHWLGPWSFTTFMGRLDDDRVVPNARLFGARFVFKPRPSLEIGFSRTAQWCGEGRLCDLEAFGNLLIGKDNRGINVAQAKEPGNQLAGIDLRWTPRWLDRRSAVYLQWTAEDTRQGGPQLGNWLRQVGFEWSGTAFGGPWRQRNYFEISDTTCQQGGFGFEGAQPNCAYRHGIYQTGYRYDGRAIGHGMDSNGLSLSLGSILQRPDGRSWQFSLRRIDVKRSGFADPNHTISPTPQRRSEALAVHVQPFRRMEVRAGLGYRDIADNANTAIDGGSFFGWVELVVR